jgi:hypothetical protein
VRAEIAGTEVGMGRVFLMLGGLALASLTSAASARAQVTGARGAGTRAAVDSAIPREFLPPDNMCRIWLDGVPASQQPAPTDCSIAVRNRPPNGRVIYGPQRAAAPGRTMRDLPIRRFDGRTPPPVAGAARPDVPVATREPWEARRVTDEQLFGDRSAGVPAGGVPGAAVMAGGGAASLPGDAWVGQGGLLVAPTAGFDPRYFSAAPPPGRGSTTCLDRDGDGWCDDFRFGPPPCLDRDQDGRCDDVPAFAALPYPQVLPRMQAAVDVVQGRPNTEVAQWLGTNEFVVRLPDQGRGIPWRAIFLDASGTDLLQVWTDRNRDGLVDRVEVFRNGQRVKLIQR